MQGRKRLAGIAGSSVFILALFSLCIVLVACGGQQSPLPRPQEVATDVALRRAYAHAAPAYSPDGDRIAYTSNRDVETHIWVMDADGSNQRNLTIGRTKDDFDPAWSPDGERLVYSSNVAPQQVDIIVINLNDQTQVNVSEQLGLNPYHINEQGVFSPDGSMLAFASRRPAGSEIYVVDAATFEIVYSTNGLVGSFGDPSWSPDSTRIAFSSLNPREEGLWVAEVDGSGAAQDAAQIVGRRIEEAVWSPVDDRIAFTSGAFSNINLFTIRADGSDERNLSENARMIIERPRWSPDGTRIAFQGVNNRQLDVWVADVDSGELSNLTADRPATFEFRPYWSPDGRYLIYLSNEGQAQNIWRMEADGSERQALTTSEPGSANS